MYPVRRTPYSASRGADGQRRVTARRSRANTGFREAQPSQYGAKRPC